MKPPLAALVLLVQASCVHLMPNAVRASVSQRARVVLRGAVPACSSVVETVCMALLGTSAALAPPVQAFCVDRLRSAVVGSALQMARDARRLALQVWSSAAVSACLELPTTRAARVQRELGFSARAAPNVVTESASKMARDVRSTAPRVWSSAVENACLVTPLHRAALVRRVLASFAKRRLSAVTESVS
mmetsp:Transcript_26742/g.75310  ORF Transcript_26742/g.75310 Transcript_26742/m.75310 type:complete len:189 (+) Transcript_26742:291-857(+)